MPAEWYQRIPSGAGNGARRFEQWWPAFENDSPHWVARVLGCFSLLTLVLYRVAVRGATDFYTVTVKC